MDVAKERSERMDSVRSSSIKVKPYTITREAVWEAYKKVKANRGSAGIDGQTITDFEIDLKNNLYRIWNRMSSGSYIPPAVLKVEIPKASGSGKRPLGIPTVSDRIAQMVVKQQIESKIDPIFHYNSYGYRPGKSAHQAVGAARMRCWHYDWVIDLDIKGFFDTIDHELLLSAVRKHVNEAWCLLYIERWLRAPSVTRVITRNRSSQDTIEEHHTSERMIGTPQGGVISPLLANLFMHYVFDAWMTRYYPQVVFERYADDIVLHCKTERQAHFVLSAIRARMQECGLALHPEKTKVVYCKDAARKGRSKHESFDFLGYGFRPRRSRSKQGLRTINFVPAISRSASAKIRAEIKKWKLHLWTNTSIVKIAEKINPVVTGWIRYYGRYHKSALYPVLNHLERRLIKWVQRTYKHLKSHPRRAREWVIRIRGKTPELFAHWQLSRWCGESG